MAQVLYRKYRSTKFSDLVGQDHISSTLTKALKKGAIAHAYLLTGPRGVGKTSVARILAHEVNEIDYNLDEFHIDIIEIDAASNRRIDEIRELRDKINLAPTQLKYKVYIIDEVHMLTREAFNALLKTLEEPPEHVIFILATTELNKVPETIVSRCQRFTFKYVDDHTLVGHLKSIASSESIKIDDESLQIIAEHSGGSFRDALSLLDQLGSMSSHVTSEDTRNVLGLPDDAKVKLLLSNLESGDFATTITDYRNLMIDGADPVILAAQLSDRIRRELPNHSNQAKMIGLLGDLLNVSKSRDPEVELEIILLKNLPEENLTSSPVVSQPTRDTAPSDDVTDVSTAPEQEQPDKPLKTPKPSLKKTKATKKKADSKEKETTKKKPKSTDPIDEDDWQRVLGHIKDSKNTLYTILRMAELDTDGGMVRLLFKFPFHQKRASDQSNRELILSSLDSLGIEHNGLEIVLAKDAAQPKKPAKPKPKEVSTPSKKQAGKQPPEEISEIFGGAEVLES
ncbi:MAG: DNA polymerase III subunit gamma/tau [Patescibacteria group bacterium]